MVTILLSVAAISSEVTISSRLTGDTAGCGTARAARVQFRRHFPGVTWRVATAPAPACPVWYPQYPLAWAGFVHFSPLFLSIPRHVTFSFFVGISLWSLHPLALCSIHGMFITHASHLAKRFSISQILVDPNLAQPVAAMECGLWDPGLGHRLIPTPLPSWILCCALSWLLLPTLRRPFE